ncbi:hypothetical protein [uncultured Psychroserpens sp.]|uniref:hypothetical protein n=1 Tax=uncultured Psychroserpens sp. TaxID=255436 RepID=UPI002638B85D|nr:hypothetical protein [uncultured Psychroserpens sp.]
MKTVKQIFKIKRLAFLMLILVSVASISCEDEDKNPLNDILADSGGFVRFATPFPTVVNVSDLSEVPGVVINNVLEAPDGNVVSYRMEASAMVAGTTYGPLPYGEEITSFPTPITITIVDLADFFGFDVNTIGFGDTFSFTGTAVNDRGIVYTSEDLDFDDETGTRSGGNNTDDLIDEIGYRDAFEFGFAIPCPPLDNPTVGDWTIDMTDLYGDGWDGAFVTVSIDGTETDYEIVDGDSAIHVFNVPSGTSVLRISYTSGSWEEEHIYSIINPDGVVFGPFGPEPGMCPEIGI